ncbi:MAG: DUF2079 domain-containing protein [Nanoarchaeota archaeon]|nr:DUF2079 domain-containing protein [Nanoarchaeota archaeon]MBU1643551.1 DUF2079 domain-containing protein [Nanoarchaeota archaeon]MBU1976635.1 DUF2079 domain-containing protein [Nanoarchaeota archaeon]
MEKNKKILLIIFIITLVVRLVLAFSIPNLTYESYYHLRHVEHIKETGTPLFQDPLSYGGREVLFLPFFHYLMAFFDLFLPTIVITKIIPNILIALITITSYFTAKKITKNETASLLSSLITGFLPILFFTNSFTVETLSLPLTFLTIYAFMNINSKKHLYLYVISFLLLSLTSFSAFLVLIGFGIYLLLSKIENKKTNKAEVEVIIFSLFFFLWVQFLFFKSSFIRKGISFIWQNIPSNIISEYFPTFSIPQALLLVSIIPVLTGAYIVYNSLFHLKNQKAFLLISFVIATTIFTWLKLIMFKQSLAFFGVILAILFASFYNDMETYFNKTKLSGYNRIILPVTVLLLLLSTVIPAISSALQQDTPTNEEIEAYRWLKDHTPKESGVLTTLEEGHLVTYFSQRKNMMDNQFRMVKDVEKRAKDINALFTTPFQTLALDLLQEYNLRYVVFTPSAKEKYGITKINYATRNCFEPIFKGESKIYLVKCEIKRVK